MAPLLPPDPFSKAYALAAAAASAFCSGVSSIVLTSNAALVSFGGKQSWNKKLSGT